MGQNEKENTKFEIPVFEIASMEYKHAKEYNRNQQSNTQPKNKDDKKEWLTIKEINLIIQNIPVILQYFIPGFLCLIIFKIITGTNTSNKYTAILSCVFSYILLSVSELIFIWIKSLEQFKTNVYVRSVISIIMGLILSIIFGICYHTKRLGKIMKFISGKTQYRRIWRDVIDLDNGSNLKIYVKDYNYYVYGHFRNVEEHEDDPYIAVFGYGKFDKVTNKLLEYEPNHMDDDIKNDRNIYMIRMSNVDHIEIA